ncbi:hypothetical protein BKA82DRAFT_2464445 [Pisolithus tinctorius]|nr:hypothetical protein BKA82DRAFT_2464445 [Pisolithus tinctorius]
MNRPEQLRHTIDMFGGLFYLCTALGIYPMMPFSAHAAQVCHFYRKRFRGDECDFICSSFKCNRGGAMYEQHYESAERVLQAKGGAYAVALNFADNSSTSDEITSERRF